MKKIVLFMTMLGMSSLSFGQTALSEDFEGDVFPPTGWTTQTLIDNPDFEWFAVGNGYQLEGNVSAGITYGTSDQDENLISPSFSLADYDSAHLNFLINMGYTYFVDQGPDAEEGGDFGNLYAKISTNGGDTWSTLWVEEDQGVYVDYETMFITLDLQAYVGEDDVMIKFQLVANNADRVIIDKISVTADEGTYCAPVTGLQLNDLTETSFEIEWAGTAASYDVEFGEVGFEQGTGTLENIEDTITSFTDLEAGTGYSFYIRSVCEDDVVGEWFGPFAVYTPLSASADLNYQFGFDSGTPETAGWTIDEAAGAWGFFVDPIYEDEGQGGFAASIGSSTGPVDSWLFSRGLNIAGGQTVTITYRIRELKLPLTNNPAVFGNGGNNSLKVFVGTSPEIVEQTTPIASHLSYGAATHAQDVWEEFSFDYPVPATGTYYFGFEHTSPTQLELIGQGGIALDSFTVTSPLSTGDELANQFSVYPNPASNVIKISGNNNVLVNGVTVTDLNGRTVKTVKFNNVASAEVNIENLAAGMYMVNITSDKGTATKKIVKN